MIVTLCCVCGKFLKRQKDGQTKITVSHGYCETCYKEGLAKNGLATEDDEDAVTSSEDREGGDQ